MDVKHLTFLTLLHPRLRFSVCAWTWRKSMSTIQRIRGQIHPAASLPLLRIRNVVLSPAMLPRTALSRVPTCVSGSVKKMTCVCPRLCFCAWTLIWLPLPHFSSFVNSYILSKPVSPNYDPLGRHDKPQMNFIFP